MANEQNILNVRILHAYKPAASWDKTTVLKQGEVGFESDTGKWKVGDGATTWEKLAYMVDKYALPLSGGTLSGTVFFGTTNYYIDAQANANLKSLNVDEYVKVGNGSKFYANNSGEGYFSHNLGIGVEPDDDYSLKVADNSYFYGDILLADKKQIRRNGNEVTWIGGRDGAMIRQMSYSGYSPVFSAKTTDGDWSFGPYSNNILYLTYCTDLKYNEGKNEPTTQFIFYPSGNFVSSYIGINGSNTGYRFYVNGSSFLNGDIIHNGTIYLANGKTYYINNNAQAYFNRIGIGTPPVSEYLLIVDGTSHLKGDTRISGNLYMTNSNSQICWDSDSYRQRILTTDDATSDTEVFTFQQSSDKGSSWSTLFTIKDNGKIVVPNDIIANKSIRNLEIGGGIYWNPYIESGTDASDVASITVIKNGCAGGTELRISQQNDATDVINLTTNSYIYLNGKRTFQINDGWLRINQDLGFSSGIYTGQSMVRTDNQFQIGDNGNKFYVNSSGNGYINNTLGIGGIDTTYKLYVNGISYLKGNTTYGGHIYADTNYAYDIGQSTKEFKNLYTRAIAARHIDADAVFTGDHFLYIGYGSAAYTTEIKMYYSSSLENRIEYFRINSNGAYALTRFGVNGQNTSYTFYVNGSSYLNGNTDIAGNLNVTGDYYWYGGKNFVLRSTANNQEWSFDLNSGTTGYTGTYAQFWSAKLSNIIQAYYTDTGEVYSPYFMGIAIRGNSNYKLSIGGNTRIESNTPNFYITDKNTGVNTYSIIRFGTTDTAGATNANAAYIFLNGPQRTDDGGKNLMTIRNNVGNLRLDNSVINTGRLTVGQGTLNTSYTTYSSGTIGNPNGLVSFVQNNIIIGNNVDFNTLVTPGCYKVQMSAWGAAATYHSPNEWGSIYSYGLLFVFRGASSDGEKRVHQIYYPHQTNASHPILNRMHNGADMSTGWQPWTRMAREMQNGTANRIAYYNNAQTISSGNNIWTNGTKLGVNTTSEPGYQFYVNGTSYFNNLVTVRTAEHHLGIKLGNTYLNAINGDLIFQNNSAIRFGTDAWDYNQWAGLKYVHSTKTIYLGLADGTYFTANSAQSGGSFKIVGMSTVDMNKTASIRNLAIGGGIYWDPYVESATDGSDTASITVIKNGSAGGTELRISQLNDASDIINLVVNKSIYMNSKLAFNISDSWLRINETGGFSSGTYFGNTIVRTDGQFQVGNNGGNFYANSSGNGYFSNTLGIAGTNTGYKLYVNGNARFQTAVNQEVIISGRWMPGSAVTGNQDGNDRPGLRIFGDYPQLVLMSGRAGNANHGSTISLGGFDSATATNGAFKMFTIGTPGYNVNFMDIGYGTSTNPHSNGMNGYGGYRIMRFNSSGTVQAYNRFDACNRSNSASYMESAIQIRERGFGGVQDDTWATAPRLSWHWSGRVQTQIGLASNGELYLSKNQFANAYKLLYENGGTWGINISGNAAAAHRLIDQGTITAINGTSRYTSGLKIGRIYNSGYPFSYGVTLTMEASNFGAELIFNGLGGGGATGSGDMRFRTHSDWNTSEWGNWRTVLDNVNYAGILDSRYVNVSGDIMTGNLTVPSVYTSNWFRSTGATGWYSETFGGGWYMTDSTYIRNYNGKTVRMDNVCLGADNNSYRLYVNGDAYFSGTNHVYGTTWVSGTLNIGNTGYGDYPLAVTVKSLFQEDMTCAKVTIRSGLYLTSWTSSTYGGKINFGDGDYVHLYEITDDKLEIKSNYTWLTSNVAIGLGSGSTTTYNEHKLYVNGSGYFSSIGIFGTNTSYRLFVNGSSYFNSSIYTGSTIYFGGGTTYYVNASATSYLFHLSIGGVNTSYKLYVNGSSYFNGALTFYGSDSFGIFTTRTNYGSIGSSSYKWYRSYINNMYGTVSSSGSDYAEYFEWADSNTNNEDRVGLFVTFDEKYPKKIRIANEKDTYILGIVSGKPSIIGNSDEDSYKYQYETDDFGRYIYEDKEHKKIKERETYDKTKKYIPRSKRQEWDTIGMLGVLPIKDNGLCEVGGYCKCGDNGIAIPSDFGYRIVERISKNVIKVVFK